MSMVSKILGWLLIISFWVMLLVLLIDEKNPEIFAKYQVITLKGTTFDMDVTVLITDDTAFAVKYVRENLDSSAKSEHFNARAVTFVTVDGKPPIIWLPHNTPIEVVNHELLHATIDIMNWAGVPLTDSTEEVYAYELQYLSNEFYNQIKPTK